MKQIITLNYVQAEALAHAVQTVLQDGRELPAGSPQRLTPLQVLSSHAVLPGLFTRLHRQLLSYNLRPGSRRGHELKLGLSLAELLAVYYCVPRSQDNTCLCVAMMQVHQRLLRFDQYVRLV